MGVSAGCDEKHDEIVGIAIMGVRTSTGHRLKTHQPQKMKKSQPLSQREILLPNIIPQITIIIYNHSNHEKLQKK